MLYIKDFKNNNIDEKYYKAIEKVRKTPEYKKNERQIEIIRNTFKKYPDIPQDLIETLIDAVQENVAMEYEAILFKKTN